MKTRHLLRLLSLPSVLCLLTSGLLAQQLPQPRLANDDATAPTTGTAATLTTADVTTGTGAAAPIQNPESKIQNSQDEIVEMSPFEVNAQKDEGYSAQSTTAGSRVATALKDTSASISVFSTEFLNDVGASTIEDMLSYAGNAEAELEDTGGFNNLDARGAGNGDTRFRIRGMSMSVAMDGLETSFAADTYNIDRAEISSGANSIQFGTGPGGGMVTLTSKRANFQRNTTRIQTGIGTWNNLGQPWNYYRATIDYNVVLMPKILAFRLDGLYQDGGNSSWRYNMITRDKRINPVVSYRPWKNTTISAAYETGRRRESTTYTWAPLDQISAWLAWRDQVRQTDPTFNGAIYGFGSTVALPYVYNNNPLTGNTTYVPAIIYNNNNASTADSNIVFVDNDSSFQDVRRDFISTNFWQSGGGAKTPNSNTFILPLDVASPFYNSAGPAGVRTIKFDRYQLTIEQRIGNLNLQLGYFHNKSSTRAMAPQENQVTLQADPNGYIYPGDAGDTSANNGAGAILNPWAGRLYIQDFWQKASNIVTNDALRLTAEYSLNLKKYGRHRIVALFERNLNERLNVGQRQVFLDQNQMAMSNPDDLTDRTNFVFHRQYVDEGDFKTYYAGDATILVPDITIGNNTYHAQWVSNGDNPTHAKRTINSAMIALQDYLFNDRLVTMFGLRMDDTSVRWENSSIIDDPTDPRVLSGAKAYHEYDFDGTWGESKRRRPLTYQAGAVWHATNRFSVFYNVSTNRGAPDTSSTTVLPTGKDKPITVGKSKDFGVMFDVFGNDKLTLRITRFDATQTNGTGLFNNPDMGYTNLRNIYDALYFLRTTNGTFNGPGKDHIWPGGTGPDYGPGADGNPWGWQYAVTPPTSKYPYGKPLIYNLTMSDLQSRGYELEIVGRPTRNIEIRLAASYQDRHRINLFTDVINYFNNNISTWMAMADPDNPNYVPNKNPNPYGVVDGIYYVDISNMSNRAGQNYVTLLDFLRNQLYAPQGTAYGGGTSVRYGLISQMLSKSGPLANRPLKFNLTGRYRFNTGILKGLNIGGTVRYQDPPYLNDPTADTINPPMPPQGTTDLAFNPDDYMNGKSTIRGGSLLFYDAFLNYRMKLFGGRSNATFQINIRNLFNSYVITTGQYAKMSTQGDSTMVVRRIYLNDPRSIRLTATFDF